ncbi:MAG: hypothetical protein ACJAVM_000103 [Sulfitobacter sp.]|jgi:hypothetical protein
MTATAGFQYPVNATTTSELPVDEDCVIQRGVQRLAGVSLMMAAAGLWVLPGSNLETEVMLFKLGLSVTGALAGAGLMQASSNARKPVVEIDTIRREVRLMHPDRNTSGKVLKRCKFDHLARAAREGNIVRLWDENNVLLVEMTLNSRQALSSLVGALRDVGKLA